MSESVVIEREGSLLTLRINRLEKKNALTLSMYEHLAVAFEQANTDSGITAVLLTGGNECFTSGNDIADFLEQPLRGLDNPVFRFMRSVFNCSKPVIAAVAGPAVGIGTTLLLHCDFVYVSRDARLKMPFVNLGLCPEFGSSLILPRLIGHAKASQLLLLGESFSGEQAADWGIATAALDSGQAALDKAREVAARLDNLAADAVRISKQLMKAPEREALLSVIAHEGELFAERLRSPEAIAALSGFMSKR